MEVYFDLSRLFGGQKQNKKPSPHTSNNLNSLSQWDPKLHAQGVSHASGDTQKELEEPSLVTWWRLLKALTQMYSLSEQLWMAGGTTRWTYVTLCLMPHRSQHVDCVQGISAEALCLIFCIRPHSFSTRDACTNPLWGKGQRWDPEKLLRNVVMAADTFPLHHNICGTASTPWPKT